MCVLSLLGECVLALKSMIGSTAQQFHTYLSHRGEETGNIRGSMRVRVPSERMGTRERLYGNYGGIDRLYFWPEEREGVNEAAETVNEWKENMWVVLCPSIFIVFFQSGSVWTRTTQADPKGNPLWWPEWDMNMSSQYSLLVQFFSWYSFRVECKTLTLKIKIGCQLLNLSCYVFVPLLHLVSFTLRQSPFWILGIVCCRFRPSVVRKQLGELGKLSEEGERTSKEETAARYGHTVLCTHWPSNTHAKNTTCQNHFKCVDFYTIKPTALFVFVL